ncbi:hypothetical protein BC939DRAFT_479073 [Gamsiella multidivaricata]|uniref:uncharacterized protein n=1 Tax=Gamsiella multidivaricata TaxID=101098 RepID=UPI00221E7878|nr:uncharacterized protein BC939DRAFT_479073 [Gamsiella multidivaricata]KAI7820120.1 hypothetical protein BC939DRAFT_479073 [Gamsiella multidivaricata]
MVMEKKRLRYYKSVEEHKVGEARFSNGVQESLAKTPRGQSLVARHRIDNEDHSQELWMRSGVEKQLDNGSLAPTYLYTPHVRRSREGIMVPCRRKVDTAGKSIAHERAWKGYSEIVDVPIVPYNRLFLCSLHRFLRYLTLANPYSGSYGTTHGSCTAFGYLSTSPGICHRLCVID